MTTARLWCAPWLVTLAAAGVLRLTAPVVAEPPVRAVTYSPHAAHVSCHVNLGPTGAAAWMRGYQFVVVSIQQRSPAFERLRLGDVVVGVGGVEFGPQADPRITLGNAIGRAEADGSPLQLSVVRGGDRTEVAIDLPRLGAYAPTWPAGCDKSRRILEDACRSLLDSQLPQGHQLTDGAFGTFASGLLFLAVDDPRYLDAARRAAHFTADLDLAGMTYNNWAMGYGGVLLAEYFLATGDDSVLPKLEEVAGLIARGQMVCGSWGHNSPSGGYGALNQTGLVCAMTLVLARECGVAVDEAALQRALDFFARYAATGSVPYGDHRPGNALDDNGKNSMAAVLFHLAGRPDEAQAFAASAAASYWLREEGHTGGFFSIMWGPLGASLAGPDRLQAFLDYQTWYYDLARQWTGGITILPYKEALTRFDDSGYIDAGGDFTTGGLALVYALPRRHLRITGAPPSVFGATLAGELRTARDHYVARRWEACDAALNAIDPTRLRDDQQRYWLEQLRAARESMKASTERVLQEVACNLQDGAAFRALCQFEALKRAVGEAADPRFADLEQRFGEGTTAWYVREGQTFYERWDKLMGYTVVSWVPQGRQAKRLLEAVPSARLAYWEPLSPTSDLRPQPWRNKLFEPGVAPDEGWVRPDFDDTAWHESEGVHTRFTAAAGEPTDAGEVAARRRFTVDDPQGQALRIRLQTVRTALTRVYLNGVLVTDVERGQRGGYATIPLDPAALGLLRRGENVLAVTSTAQGQNANRLDVGLDIRREPMPRGCLPIERAERLYADDLPDVDTTLRVDETTQRFRAALRQSYLDLPVTDLLGRLRSVMAHDRALAEDALVAHGLDGVRPALELIDDADWKARASALAVLQKALKRFGEERHDAALALLRAQVPAAAARVRDEHLWVRVQACTALGELGAAAKDAVGVLAEAADDPQEWVRQSALTALQRIGADDATVFAAVREAVAVRNSSFGIPKDAVAVVKGSTAAPEGKLEVLVQVLRHPPEGGGGALLAEAIDLACSLDADGRVMVPVLIDAAADETGLSRQRGNPRRRAIEALGRYGPRARAAVPTLEAILADDSEAGKAQHEAAKAALDAIGR